MRQILFSKIRRQKWVAITFILALLTILIVLPVSINSILNAQQDVESNITHYARGSYDLLVRAEGNQHPLEEELGIVPENYIGFGDGGISVDEWQTILNRDDIEVAAPVASLGYFTAFDSNFGVMFLDTSSYYETTYFTSDGVNDYQIGDPYKCYLLELPAEIAQNEFTDYDEVFNSLDLMNFCKDDAPNFPYPTNYSLIVGIDPSEEEKLIGASFEDIHPESRTVGPANMFRNSNFKNSPLIPVVEIEGEYASLTAKVISETLEFDDDDMYYLREKYELSDDPEDIYTRFINLQDNKEIIELIIEDLDTVTRKESYEYEVVLSDYLKAFHQDGLILFEDGEVAKLEDHNELFGGRYFINFNFINNPVHYIAGHPNYVHTDDGLKIEAIGEENGIPIYREIRQRGMTSIEAVESNSDDVVIVNPVASVRLDEHEEQLASSPLGIYQMAPAYSIDEDGNENRLYPTLTPGSFMTSPAKGVTNIESAEIVKGDKPIDAIRVKVAGFNSYTDEAAEKIYKIADEIEDMGLQVTIVAGASPQQLEIEVENIGTVIESWTTLGAAGTIIQEWSLTNILLAILFTLVALTYMINRMQYWSVLNRHDIKLYQQLGWSNTDIRKLFMNEILILTTTSLIISLPIVILLAYFLNVTILMLYLIVALLLFVLIMVLSLRHIRRITQFESHNEKRRISAFFKDSLVMRNILFYKKHLRAPFIQLLLVSALTALVYLALTSTVTSTNVTALGEYINIQIDYLHVVILASGAILAVSTLFESLYSLLKSREEELGTYRSIGWSLKDIFNLLFRESLLWTIIAIVLGSLVSYIIYSSFFSHSVTALLVSTFVTVILYLIVIMIVSLFLRKTLRKRINETIGIVRS